MRLTDQNNEDEYRFPHANTLLVPNSNIAEFPIIKADVTPLPNVNYEVRIFTTTSNLINDFKITVNLNGEHGDTYPRNLNNCLSNKQHMDFGENSVNLHKL